MHWSHELQGSLKRRRKHPHPTSINGYHTVKNGLGTIVSKRPTFAFTGENGYTLVFAQRTAHKRLHSETRGPLPWPQRGFALPAKSSPKEQPEEADARLMACVRFLRRRGPAGLLNLFLFC